MLVRLATAFIICWNTDIPKKILGAINKNTSGAWRTNYVVPTCKPDTDIMPSKQNAIKGRWTKAHSKYSKPHDDTATHPAHYYTCTHPTDPLARRLQTVRHSSPYTKNVGQRTEAPMPSLTVSAGQTEFPCMWLLTQCFCVTKPTSWRP